MVTDYVVYNKILGGWGRENCQVIAVKFSSVKLKLRCSYDHD